MGKTNAKHWIWAELTCEVSPLMPKNVSFFLRDDNNFPQVELGTKSSSFKYMAACGYLQLSYSYKG